MLYSYREGGEELTQLLENSVAIWIHLSASLELQPQNDHCEGFAWIQAHRILQNWLWPD